MEFTASMFPKGVEKVEAEKSEFSDPLVQTIFDTMSEDQKSLLYLIAESVMHETEVRKNRQIGALKRKIKKLEKEISNLKKEGIGYEYY